MSDSRKARTSIFPLHYTYSLIAITPTGIKKEKTKRQRKEEKINKNQNTQRKEREKKTHNPNHIRNIAN